MVHTVYDLRNLSSKFTYCSEAELNAKRHAVRRSDGVGAPTTNSQRPTTNHYTLTKVLFRYIYHNNA